MKKVLLVVVDALASRIVLPALEAGALPTFAALAERGLVRSECTSIFPSITPAATASIATGVYPTDHHIAGAFWYDRLEDSVAYYGDDLWVMLREGMNKFINDFMVRLNHDRLHAETLYQRIERCGLTAAAVNYMWFRGETQHAVSAPLLLKLFPGVQFAAHLLGPKVLCMADFAASTLPGSERKLQAKGGMTRRYGFHDATTTEYLLDLADADPFPDFTLAYYPNNDFVSHDEGPRNALAALQEVDQGLQQFIERMGGFDKFLEKFAVIISGDHSQTDVISDAEQRRIDVAAMLDAFQLAQAGKPWQDGDELMICPNMRACHIYFKKRGSSLRDAVVDRLLQDRRVDQVLWRESVWDGADPNRHVRPGADTFCVATAERGRLTFRYAHDDPQATADVYGNRWTWEGDLRTVDATREEGNRLRYDEYPNALERIATGFCQLAGDVWVTAIPGCEFAVQETSVHDGGSHGALNRDDSTAPLIVAGIPQHVTVPQHARTIDIAPLCLQVLDLEKEAERLVASRS